MERCVERQRGPWRISRVTQALADLRDAEATVASALECRSKATGSDVRRAVMALAGWLTGRLADELAEFPEMRGGEVEITSGVQQAAGPVRGKGGILFEMGGAKFTEVEKALPGRQGRGKKARVIQQRCIGPYYVQYQYPMQLAQKNRDEKSSKSAAR